MNPHHSDRRIIRIALYRNFKSLARNDLRWRALRSRLARFLRINTHARNVPHSDIRNRRAVIGDCRLWWWLPT
jgi:hypothetical protein